MFFCSVQVPDSEISNSKLMLVISLSRLKTSSSLQSGAPGSLRPMILKVMGSFTMGYSPTGLTLEDSSAVVWEPLFAVLCPLSEEPQPASMPTVKAAVRPKDSICFSFILVSSFLLH